MGGLVKVRELEIDKYDLEEEWVKQPMLYGKYARIAADARLEYDQAKSDLEVARAELSKEVREEPERFGLDKVTEGAIGSTIIVQKRFKEVVEQVNDARHRLDVVSAMVAALDHRKTALSKLVDLFLSNYYSKPRASAESREEISEVEKRASRRRVRVRERDEGLTKAGQFEQITIAFETMLGSVKETKKTLADLTEFAALTPFEMPEILQAARGLIQFGERGDEMMETLNMLGNAASGTSTPFGFLALIFNQVRVVGKLSTQDFRQLSTRGILSLQDIAKHYGVTTSAAQKMLSAGQVSFEDLKNILRGLSEEGGRFRTSEVEKRASRRRVRVRERDEG